MAVVNAYVSFLDTPQQAVISRLYGSIHYRTAIEMGLDVSVVMDEIAYFARHQSPIVQEYSHKTMLVGLMSMATAKQVQKPSLPML